MDFGNEIASNENEFDFELLRKEIDCIHEGIIDRGNESSIGDSDIVLSVRNWKIRTIDSESESDSNAPQDSNNSEWTSCEKSSEIPPRIKFIVAEKSAGLQIFLKCWRNC